MSDDPSPSPVPLGLEEHVHRSKTGKTVMAITMSIETRARLHQAALDLGVSKMALVRSAILQYLIHHEETRVMGQAAALAAVSVVTPPIKQSLQPTAELLDPDPEPVAVSEPTVVPVMVPEPEPEPEPVPGPVVETTQSVSTPSQTSRGPSKRSRRQS